MANANEIQELHYDAVYNNSCGQLTRVPEKTRNSLNCFLNQVAKDKNSKVLEIGCGDGLLTKYLVDRGYRVTAIDISPVAIERIQQNFKHEIKKGVLKVVISDAVEYLQKSDDKFDLIVGSGIIHHIDIKCWDQLFSLANQHLSKNGLFACGPEPNANGLYSFFWPLAPTVYKLFGGYYNWEVEKGTLNMKTAVLHQYLKKAGFNCISINPYQTLPDFNISFLTNINTHFLNKIPGKYSMYISIVAG